MRLLRDPPKLVTDDISRVLDAVPDPTVVMDTNGTILRVNRSAAKLLSYSTADLIGLPLANLIREDLRHGCQDHLAAFVASDEDTGPELETHFLGADASDIPIDASVGRLHMDGTAYVLLVMREVSDRLATQRRLEQMLAIDELTTSISSRLNTPDTDAIDVAIDASIRELAAFCGGCAAYLFTENHPGSYVLRSRSPGADRDGLGTLGLQTLPWIRNLVQRPSITELNTDTPSIESAPDCSRLRQHGVTGLVVIPFRAAGRTIGFVGIESTTPGRSAWPGEDLSGLIVLQDVFENALERKRIGSELRTVNRVLHAVSECHDALIRAQDENELLRDVCRIVVETGGYALAWVGYPLENDAKEIEPQAQWGTEGYVENLTLGWGVDHSGPACSAIRTRQPTVVHDTSADPTLRWHLQPHRAGFLSLVTVPMFYGHEVAGVLAVYDRQANAFDAPAMKVLQRFADDLAYGIAALRSRERQRDAESRLRELLESKDELIATIAHELRTPLAGVVGFAQLLRDGGPNLDPESRAEMIDLIAEQGMDLTNIVDDLLVAAKSEAGTLHVAEVRVDMRAQAAQVLEAWGSEVSARIHFEGPPVFTIGDPARVRQILRNLISNALRYGGKQINVRVGGDDRVVYVRVEDDGAGIAPADQDHIFLPYRRAHDAPGLTASMGLGLSISRHLAELMGGELGYQFKSDLSVFTLTMPAFSA